MAGSLMGSSAGEKRYLRSAMGRKLPTTATGQEQPLKIKYEKHMKQQAATTLLMFLTPFIAWAFHGLGGMLNKHLGRNAVNGASVYNWLSVAIAALPALANNPKAFGRILAAFAISWIVGVSLSKKHKRNHLANAVKTTDA